MGRFVLLLILAVFYEALLAQNGFEKIPLSSADSGEIAYYDSLFHYYMQIKNYKNASHSLEQIALIYWKHNYFDESIHYYKKAIETNKLIENYDGIAKINTNLALIYADKGQYDSAYKYFEKTLAYRKANNQKVGVISALINEAVVLNKLQKYDLAIEKLMQALELAREINDIKQMRSCYGMLAETYQKAGNIEKSLYYYNFFKTFNDYITEQQVQEAKLKAEREAYLRKIAELEAENQRLLLQQKQKELQKAKKTLVKLTEAQQKLMDSLSKQEMVLKIFEQKAKIAELKNKQLQQQKKIQIIIISFISVFAIFLIITALWLLRMYKKQRRLNQEIIKQNVIISNQKEELQNLFDELKEKNEEILESIQYASEIQKGIFLKNIPYSLFAKDYFEIYLPKSVVAGDFIYTAKISENRYVVSVGDCTGHGVGGAFLTILGYNLLDYIIKTDAIFSPDLILSKLLKEFYKILNQDKTENYDTMDIGICVVDLENKIIEYSGERISLYVTDGSEELTVYKADKHLFNLMGRLKQIKYKKYVIQYSENQWFYMFSDGFKDQFNENYEKFSLARIKQLLLKIHHLDGNKKKQILINELNNWQKGMFQTDDITIVGFNPK